jgi:signal transduction histidine kinase
MNFWVNPLFLIIWLVIGLIPVADAQQQGTPLPAVAEKTKAIVEAVHAFVNVHSNDMSTVQHALQTHPDFFDRDKNLYVFMHCYNIEKKEAICCAQAIRPELIGKNMWHLRTPNGRLLFYEIARMIEKEGQGWIQYDWLNPYTNTLQTKCSYLKGIVLKDGRKAWVGCGFWQKK